MIMVNEDKRFCEMYWKNWNISISNLTESNSSNLEYAKMNTMFEMSLLSNVKWNDDSKNSNNSQFDCLVHYESQEYNTN